ncbi:methylenetetrahydrofolate reductase [NAD(P)H] [Hyphomicrobium sp.]|uniref:methylenetetrahydrofolate reductase [NAD(P)H] n=1 Tax=Hyphomicrobium sp. TaxID=82 RepID=UPI002E3166C7|nr:methylenetetrahydrofolate reductase [NAD(P)H] [Hyphomicrobium sp.]HEX2842285.1 methylenetetrahydrofolate reductase [NAD(P)H] [Hyphomicrobium sp.]
MRRTRYSPCQQPHLRTSRLLGQGVISASFEFFPPRTTAMEEKLWRSVRRLEPMQPTSVAVTCGVGGATLARTHATIERILRETSLRPAAHLTCIAANRAEIDTIARNYWDLGVRNVVALRGDPPPDQEYVPKSDSYAYAADLVAGLKRVANFDITVAGYPEKHPEAATVAADIAMLKAKVDAGADRIITQFFFDNELFFRFEDLARSRGIAVPIIPGILPIHNFRQVAAVAARAGVSIPALLPRWFDGLDDDRETHRLAAAAFAAEQVMGLVDRGITDFHFYTLNRADLVYGICHMLGLRPSHPA